MKSCKCELKTNQEVESIVNRRNKSVNKQINKNKTKPLLSKCISNLITKDQF